MVVVVVVDISEWLVYDLIGKYEWIIRVASWLICPSGCGGGVYNNSTSIFIWF